MTNSKANPFSLIEKELGQLKGVFAEELRNSCQFISRLDDYILASQGKCLRPALAILSAKAAQNGNAAALKDKVLINLAAAIEMIHTATLVHDDVVDMAVMRRHKPSVNKKFGQDVSILLGDRLYSQAFKILARLNLIKLTQILSQVFIKICEAELEQVYLRSQRSIDEDKYLSITRKKTAELISFSCLAGASLKSGFGKEAKALADYGLDFGMAFQIIDDCTDLIGTEDEFGKTLGTDLKQGKITLPVIYLLKTKNGKEFKLSDDMGAKEFSRIRQALYDTGALEKARSKAGMYLNRAKNNLSAIKDSLFKRSLLDLAETYA